MSGSGLFVAGVAAALISVGLGIAGYRHGRRWYRAWRYGEPLDHGSLLVEFGRKITTAADRPSLAQVLTVELPHALQVERATLLLPDPRYLVPVEVDEAPTTGQLRLSVSHAAVRWVAASGQAQTADQGRLGKLIAQGRGDLGWTHVWVPLMRGAALRGLWLLGPRLSDAKFSPEDLSWLTAIGRQAAIVLEALSLAAQEHRASSAMRTLYRQVVAAREVERGHLSRELHDGLLQDLCAMTRDSKALAAEPDSAETHLRDLAIHSGTTVHSLRAICNDLRPPLLERDLAAALVALVGELDTRSDAPIHIDLAVNDLRLPDDVALAIFRIAQEAAHNAIRHAEASEIALRLTEYPDQLRLTVTDDGRGIEGGVDAARLVARGHFGLAGMLERAAMIGAKLDVQTAPDYGTVVILELPHK